MSDYKNFLILNGNEIAVIAFLAISVVFIVIFLTIVRKILYYFSPFAYKYIAFIGNIRYALNNGFHRIEGFNNTIYAKYYNNGFYLFISRIFKFILFFIKNKDTKSENQALLDLLFENDNLAKEAIKKGYRPVATFKYPYIYFVLQGNVLSKEDYVNGKTVNNFGNNESSYVAGFKNDSYEIFTNNDGFEQDYSGIDDFGNIYIYDDIDISNIMQDN